MTVFSRGVPLNQVLFICIDICLSCLQVGTRGHLFTSTRCHLFTSTCCHLFTSTRCHLFTRVYNSLQVHVSPRSDVTFGNDVIHHNSTTKSGSKVIFYTTADVVAVYHDYIVACCLLSIFVSLSQIATFTFITH